jgi:hypothetical protein
MRAQPTGNGRKVGLAWYRADQWEQLRDVSADKAQLEERFSEWLAHAEAKLKELRALDINVLAVPVDVGDLISWCRERARPVNEDSRSAYTLEKLKTQPG